MKHDNVALDLFDRREVEDVLSGAFYSEAPWGSGSAARPSAPCPGAEAPRGRERAKTLSKPDHYKVICISLYTEDLARLDEMVGELKKKGLTKANRSALIRQALMQVDLDKVPKGI